MKNVTARKAHEIPNRPPVRVSVGEQVQVGECDTQWPEFVLVTTSHGAGWVPARYLSKPSDGIARVQTAYDTTELATQAGEVLEVIAEDRQSGWLWCRSTAGQGWVPVNTSTRAEPEEARRLPTRFRSQGLGQRPLSFYRGVSPAPATLAR